MSDSERVVSLVTGATRGIGRAIAARLCAAGEIVYGFGRNLEAGSLVENELEGFRFIQGDVTSRQDVDGAVKNIVDAEGQLDHLVCNAGITRDQLLMRMSDEDWHAVLQTNLTGAFYCMRACIRHLLRSRCGAIVSVASIVGETGNAGQANYAASKAGLIALSRSVAKEVARKHVRVNVVTPGFVESDMTAALPEAVRSDYLARIPLERGASPDEIASVVAFLLSEEASYITGQVVGVNGGLYP